MTAQLLAIDPGNVESAFVILEPVTCRPVEFGKVRNVEVLDLVSHFPGQVFIEMVASYGMPVGAEVFETCVWIGRYMQAHAMGTGESSQLVYRLAVKLHHCHDSKAKDPNITRALVDRFAHGQPNYGKGTKVEPGWFYGFRADVWQAYALAVYADDVLAPAPESVL